MESRTSLQTRYFDRSITSRDEQDMPGAAIEKLTGVQIPRRASLTACCIRKSDAS